MWHDERISRADPRNGLFHTADALHAGRCLPLENRLAGYVFYLVSHRGYTFYLLSDHLGISGNWTGGNFLLCKEADSKACSSGSCDPGDIEPFQPKKELLILARQDNINNVIKELRKN